MKCMSCLQEFIKMSVMCVYQDPSSFFCLLQSKIYAGQALCLSPSLPPLFLFFPPPLSLILLLPSDSMVCRRVCDLNFNITVCLPTRLRGCCCPEILVFPPLHACGIFFLLFLFSSSLSWQCNLTAESEKSH